MLRGDGKKAATRYTLYITKLNLLNKERYDMNNQDAVIAHSTNSATLADVLERILDKGLVIAGDIKIKLVDIELLTIQIRLLIASVEKAKELGMDWWVTNKDFNSKAVSAHSTNELEELKRRIEILESNKAKVIIQNPAESR